jgi:hypothetical protein
VSYTAEAFFGGLDRVFIYRSDSLDDTCTRLSLVSPADIQQFDVTTPMGWSVESVSVVAGADCPPDQPFAWATAGSGTAAFDSLDMFDYFPCALTVDAQFELDTDPPSAVSFTIAGLSVSGPEC